MMSIASAGHAAFGRMNEILQDVLYRGNDQICDNQPDPPRKTISETLEGMMRDFGARKRDLNERRNSCEDMRIDVSEETVKSPVEYTGKTFDSPERNENSQDPTQDTQSLARADTLDLAQRDQYSTPVASIPGLEDTSRGRWNESSPAHGRQAGDLDTQSRTKVDTHGQHDLGQRERSYPSTPVLDEFPHEQNEIELRKNSSRPGETQHRAKEHWATDQHRSADTRSERQRQSEYQNRSEQSQGREPRHWERERDMRGELRSRSGHREERSASPGRRYHSQSRSPSLDHNRPSSAGPEWTPAVVTRNFRGGDLRRVVEIVQRSPPRGGQHLRNRSPPRRGHDLRNRSPPTGHYEPRDRRRGPSGSHDDRDHRHRTPPGGDRDASSHRDGSPSSRDLDPRGRGRRSPSGGHRRPSRGSPSWSQHSSQSGGRHSHQSPSPGSSYSAANQRLRHSRSGSTSGRCAYSPSHSRDSEGRHAHAQTSGIWRGPQSRDSTSPTSPPRYHDRVYEKYPDRRDHVERISTETSLRRDNDRDHEKYTDRDLERHQHVQRRHSSGKRPSEKHHDHHKQTDKISRVKTRSQGRSVQTRRPSTMDSYYDDYDDSVHRQKYEKAGGEKKSFGDVSGDDDMSGSDSDEETEGFPVRKSYRRDTNRSRDEHSERKEEARRKSREKEHPGTGRYRATGHDSLHSSAKITSKRSSIDSRHSYESTKRSRSPPTDEEMNEGSKRFRRRSGSSKRSRSRQRSGSAARSLRRPHILDELYPLTVTSSVG